MFPLVPYHALPKLHELIKADMPTPYNNGLLEAYREIIPALLRQSKDPTYYVQRQLPPPPANVDLSAGNLVLSGAGKPIVKGWIEVGDSALLLNEDVVRFDYDNQTYALYRTAAGKLYATDGLCTHGNAHLVDGMVKGTLIECAKHNCWFDVRDGSPQRLPVCVGLKTYAVRERDGKLLLDLTSAGGYGVTAPAATHTFRVVSNDHVATFIKELVLEPASASPQFNYQPGDYLQLDIPVYAERSLQNVEVKPPYVNVWQTQHVFDYMAANPTPCRRNYSLATNPAKDKQLRFNIRIAAPPRGVNCHAGIGSSYILIGNEMSALVTSFFATNVAGL